MSLYPTTNILLFHAFIDQPFFFLLFFFFFLSPTSFLFVFYILIFFLQQEFRTKLLYIYLCSYHCIQLQISSYFSSLLTSLFSPFFFFFLSHIVFFFFYISDFSSNRSSELVYLHYICVHIRVIVSNYKQIIMYHFVYTIAIQNEITAVLISLLLKRIVLVILIVCDTVCQLERGT